MRKLAEWIEKSEHNRVAFARAVGVSPGLITRLCNGEVWPSKRVAERIAKATNGAVMANDFMAPPSQEDSAA